LSAARITAVGTALPPVSYTQDELLEIFRITDPRVRSIFRNSAISRRGLVLPPPGADGTPRRETQGELLRKHVLNGISMGRDALHACLKRAGASLADVRYLCCVSSTGFITPGFSALLIKDLGLSRNCSRLDVVGMGCNAGLNALAATASWAGTHRGQLAVMICIEACSAAYVVDGTLRTAVVNSLFGDGAAAVSVVAGQDDDDAVGPALLGFSSYIIPEAADAMRFDWDDEQGRFSFFLDPEVPYVVGANAGHAIRCLLADTCVRQSDIAHWLLHSGGKKVIDAVRVNLGLSRHDTRHTVSVLRDFGNMSSGSFLFSYERLLEERIAAAGDYGIFMAMGPGSSIEMALARW
jgi:alkylresorcinol/alkylpyrone synthase/polyketide synthase Type III